jgi:hypothetical protein
VTSSTFSSNSIRLTGRDWLITVGIVLLVLALFPSIWGASEDYAPAEEYRFPYDAGNDYWLYSRWCRQAAEKYTHFTIGDSVMWGQYVVPGETPAILLNKKTDSNTWANLGVNGIHPLAMAGLVQNFAPGLKGKKVMVNLNFLWMTSVDRDLSMTEMLEGEKQVSFNHPRLIPQVFPDIKCHNPELNELMGIFLERNIPFFACLNHIQTIYLTGYTIHQWTLESAAYPEEDPEEITIPEPENAPRANPNSWDKKDDTIKGFDWVALEKSFQWDAFKRTVSLLQGRHNDVFVLVVPINPYMQSEASLKAYRKLQDGALAYLKEQNIPFYLADKLPSELYADASHPLAAGYGQIVDELLLDSAFQAWVK